MGELRALDWDKEMARWWWDVEKAQWKGILRENYGQHLVCTL